jgi:CTP:molybdopterin cytidylyltransferase MocA
MDAIVTAGGVSLPADPLYQLTGLPKKAIIPLVNRPMITWVVDALWQSGLIDHMVIVGLKPGEVDLGRAGIDFIDAGDEMIGSILAGVEWLRQTHPAARKILMASSDIPLITPDIVRGFVAECGAQDADGYYTVVEKKVMDARFPGSKRTFVPLKNGRYSGGDLFLFDVAIASKIDLTLISSLTGSRKNYWNQARLLGFGFIARFLLGLMTVHEAAARASKILNVDVKAVETRFAEVGMDLDKPHQYEMIKAVLEQRAAEGQPGR